MIWRALDRWPWPKVRPSRTRSYRPSDEVVLKLRGEVRDRMVCPHCGTNRLSFGDVQAATGIRKSVLWYFLDGKKPHLATFNRLAEWVSR